jgi:hypothetical protein
MFTRTRPPPSAGRESWLALTAPSAVAVEAFANRAVPAVPNRVSVPSPAAPTAVGTVPGCAASAQESSPSEVPNSTVMTARSSQPWRVSPTIRPYMRGIADGTSSIRRISTVFVQLVGLSSGWAEFAW